MPNKRRKEHESSKRFRKRTQAETLAKLEIKRRSRLFSHKNKKSPELRGFHKGESLVKKSKRSAETQQGAKQKTYLMRMTTPTGTFYKIGRSTDPEKRRKSLETTPETKIEIVETSTTIEEKRLHYIFKEKNYKNARARTKGMKFRKRSHSHLTEWFILEPTDVDFCLRIMRDEFTEDRLNNFLIEAEVTKSARNTKELLQNLRRIKRGKTLVDPFNFSNF